MNLLVNFKSAVSALLKNKRRSFLTMIGIIIGVSAVITIMAIGKGFERKTLQELTNSKEGQLSVDVMFQTEGEEGFVGRAEDSPFTKEDQDMIAEIAGVDSVKPQTFENEENLYTSIMVKGKQKSLNGSSNLKKHREIIAGRKIEEGENDITAPVAMIDSAVAEDLFGSSEDAIGRGFDLQGILFTVVGVYPGEKTESMFSNVEDQFVIPKNSYQRYFPPNPFVIQVTVKIKNGYKPNEVTENILNELNDSGSQADKGKYTVMDMSFLTDGISNILGTITTFISAIAGISLFIAGVGVMNMMYISVSERTREIGIRRALGATQRSIMSQFLIEGLTITVTGGIIGYLFGMFVAWIFGLILELPIQIDLSTILLALGLSSLIGLIFSVFPARQAARKNVVEILR